MCLVMVVLRSPPLRDQRQRSHLCQRTMGGAEARLPATRTYSRFEPPSTNVQSPIDPPPTSFVTSLPFQPKKKKEKKRTHFFLCLNHLQLVSSPSHLMHLPETDDPRTQRVPTVVAAQRCLDKTCPIQAHPALQRAFRSHRKRLHTHVQRYHSKECATVCIARG